MRRDRAVRRQLIADPIYHSVLVTRFVNVIMIQGKKSKAERIVYKAIQGAAKKVNKEPLEVLQQAVDHARPLLEVKSRRVGGATYQVPIDVREDRGVSLALRWMRDFARAKKGRPMEEKLANELADAFGRTGAAVKKREDVHKMAEANRAFSHYKW
ncbi:MAG: 30S ribosomal protein S7 [Candidatus Omnitrophica bacterium]|nr:30S ribosomal protein S7 [Candidatus Omnitrophota bacterium]